MERLTDLDELTTRCRTASAREHIAEAVAAYRGGAYRAAIVMSWIAVIFDLIDKVRDLSTSGEPAATALLRTFENLQTQIHQGDATAMKQALEFERDLLIKVRTDLSLIDALQFSDLERLREDRHRSAHPSFNIGGEAFKPSAELSRLHLLNAITHVLSQPPVQGKAALDALKALVTSTYFPLDYDRARDQLASSAIARPTDTLVRKFIDALIFGYVDAKSDYHELQQVLATLSVLLDMHRAIAEPHVDLQMQRVVMTATDIQMPDAVAFIAAWPLGWNHLSSVARDKIFEFIIYADFAELEPSIPGLLTIVDLQAPLLERVARLSASQLQRLIAEETTATFVADAAIAKYLAATTYALARTRRRRLILPLLDQFNAKQIAAIVAGASANNQVSEEDHFPALLTRISERKIMPDEEFKALVREAGFGEMLAEDEEEA